MESRSPSPNPSRHTNPNPKTPRSTTIRSSGGFNLSKPSEIPQRNSGTKARRDVLPCMRASFEKENERDPNCLTTPKVRSPAVSFSNGAKHFMSPTISASSKAVTSATPLKKILSENNGSMSVSDSVEFPESSDAQMVLGAGKTTSVVTEGIGSKPEMGSGFREILGSTESGKTDPKIKNPQFASSIAPLDADPSLLPYDPKTNYLSPRPRFLHYKPNPRLESYLNREGSLVEIGDGMQLGDSFSSESYEDTSGNSNDAQSSLLTHNFEEEESFPVETDASESVSNGNRSKSWFFRTSTLLPLLLVVIAVCLSAPLLDSHVQFPSSSSLKVRSFANIDAPFKVYATLANMHLKGLATRFKHWSVATVNNYLANSAPKEEFGPYHLRNLTSSPIDETEGLDLLLSNTMMDLEATEEDNNNYAQEKTGMEKLEDVKEDGAEFEIGKHLVEFSENLKEDVCCMEHAEIEEEDAMKEDVEQEKDYPPYQALKIEEVNKDHEDFYSMGEMENKINGGSTCGHESLMGVECVANEEDHEDFSRGSVTALQTVENQEDSSSLGDARSDSDQEHQISNNHEVREALSVGREDNLSTQITLGLSSAIVALAIISIFLHMKKKQTTVTSMSREVASISGSSESYIHGKGRQRAEKEKENEALSNDGGARRESTISSSISYGSFTTYEKIPAKKGFRDDVSVTPVRRSSRIKNQVTSP